MNTVQKQLDDYHAYLRLKNYSKQTVTSYLRTIRLFYEFRSGSKMRGRISEEQAKQYLLMRIDSGCSWSTINCDYSALRKYFQNIINVRWSIKKIPRPQKERILPEILSKKEVVKLIEYAPTFKHQVFLTFVYGTGLRLSEALNITFPDINGDRLQIRVNKGKGAKDRVVQIPECLLQLLRMYYRRLKPVHYLFNGLKEGSRYSNRPAQWSII
jgi:site-specific recombinase XerD